MTRGSKLPTAGPGDHMVQFYGGNDELAAVVGDYLAEGFRQGDGDLVVRTRSFPFKLDSVRAARHFVIGLFNTEPDETLTSDAAIVTTELASNAVLHACSGFTLTISRSASAVRIAVRDHRPLVPGNDGLPFDITTGHGLSVVAQIAHAWSVERLPDGKLVWAELPAL